MFGAAHRTYLELGLLCFSVLLQRKWDSCVFPSLTPPTASAALCDCSPRRAAGRAGSAALPRAVGMGSSEGTQTCARASDHRSPPNPPPKHNQPAVTTTK